MRRSQRQDSTRRVGCNRWLTIAVEKLWVEASAPFGVYTNLLISDDQSDRVVVALRNLLFGSAVLGQRCPFTILSTVGLTITGYPSEMKTDCVLHGVSSEPTPAPIPFGSVGDYLMKSHDAFRRITGVPMSKTIVALSAATDC
jgi:hypothetical protein